MSDEASPRPWSVDGIDISDANGEPVTPLYFNEQDEANAALIVDAVNERDLIAARLEAFDKKLEEAVAIHDALCAERDRLRDIVRNAVETLNQVYKHADMTDALREVVAETQREARAAIGEDKE